MSLGRGHALLLPVNPAFIWVSLLCALLVDLLPLGRILWWPDLLTVVLAFWALHQPRRVGLVAAFALGLLIDVHQGTRLGQHALVYIVLVFLVQQNRRRLMWFSPWGQLALLLPLFVVAHAVMLLLQLLTGAAFPGWGIALQPVIQALLWPIVTGLLLAPQRRAPHVDAHRPL